MSSDTMGDDRPKAELSPERGPGLSYGRISRTSLPMVLSTATGIGSQAVIIGLIGQIGDAALYVRSVYAPMAYLFLALATGLAVTLQVAVAQRDVRDGSGRTAAHLGSVARTGTALYVLLGGLLVALSGVLGDAVRIAEGRQETFRTFLAAMVVANLLGMLGELLSAVLRGLGRTGTAAIITGVYVTANVGTVAVVGLGLGGGLMTVPAAAGAAGLLEILLALAVLLHGRLIEPPRLLSWRPEIPGMLLRVGLPVSFSSIILAVVNLVLLRIVAPGGEQAVAGFSVGYTIQTAVIVPAVGFGSALAVLMNQNLAAVGVEAARTVFRRGMVLAAGGYAVVTLAVVLGGGALAGLLAGDPAVAAEARDFITVVGPTFGITGLILAVLSVLEQVGRGLLALLLNATYFAVVLIVGWIATGIQHDVTALYWSMAAAAAASLFTGLPVGIRAALRPRMLHRPDDPSEVAP